MSPLWDLRCIHCGHEAADQLLSWQQAQMAQRCPSCQDMAFVRSSIQVPARPIIKGASEANGYSPATRGVNTDGKITG